MPNINTATATQADLSSAETSDLVAVYNRITGKSIKKFSDRKTAERNTWKVIQQLGPDENIWEMDENFKKIKSTKTKKPLVKKEKKQRKRTMRFCFAPGSEKDLKEPKKTSLRYKVFEMLSKKNGVLFSDIQKELNWHDKNTYEAIRLVHRTTNYGMWSVQENGDIRVFLIKEISKYKELVAEEKCTKNFQ